MCDWDEEKKAKMAAEVTITGVEELEGDEVRY